MAERKKTIKPFMPKLGSAPVPPSYSEAVAVQALGNCVADKEQQRIAMKWILEQACGLPVWPYRESVRETDIALGRHFVGQQIMGVLNIKTSLLKD